MWPMMARLQEHAAQASAQVELVSGFPDERQRMIGLSRRDDGWTLMTKGGGAALGPFDIVIADMCQAMSAVTQY